MASGASPASNEVPLLLRLAAWLTRPGAYAFAAAVTTVALLLRLWLASYLGPPYLLFFPAIVLATIAGGFGPSVLAIALSTAYSALLILPAERGAQPASLRELTSLAAFAGVSASLSYLADRFRKSQGRLHLLELERARVAADVRFGQLADAAPVLVWMSGLDMGCVWFNRTWLEFTGRTLAQEAGDGWAAGVHPDDLPTCLATYRDAFQRRRPFTMDYRLRRHDGEYRWVFDSGTPRTDEQGSFAGFIGSCVDVTARRRAEERLRLNQQRLDLAVRAGQIGLWDLDLVRDEAWRTPLHDQIFGYPGLQPVWGRQQAVRHVVPEDRPLFARAFDEALETGHFHYELRIDPASGTRRWIAADGEVIRAGDGTPIRMMGTVVDVTARKATEAALKEAEARASRAERLAAVTTLVRGLSHEVNNPLASVVSNLGYAREQVVTASGPARLAWAEADHPPLAELEEALSDAAAAAERIRVIVKDMNTLLPHELRADRSADPRETLQEALALAQEELRPCTTVDVVLPALPRVALTPEELVQVLFSLLANAGKATGPGPNHVRITGTPGAGGRVLLAVADTGTGMAPAVLQRAFEPFFTTRGVGQGKGLGLSLCRGIIDSAGGELTLASEPGRGTTATIWLPAASEAGGARAG
jgi:PAS domain S-box-containing protein